MPCWARQWRTIHVEAYSTKLNACVDAVLCFRQEGMLSIGMAEAGLQSSGVGQVARLPGFSYATRPPTKDPCVRLDRTCIDSRKRSTSCTDQRKSFIKTSSEALSGRLLRQAQGTG